MATRHQATFDSLTITILCIIVFENIFYIKNIFERFCTWSGHKSVPVTCDATDEFKRLN